MSIGDSDEGTRRECVYRRNSVLCCAKGPLASREPVVAVSVATAATPAKTSFGPAVVVITREQQQQQQQQQRESRIIVQGGTIAAGRTTRRLGTRRRTSTKWRNDSNKENWIRNDVARRTSFSFKRRVERRGKKDLNWHEDRDRKKKEGSAKSQRGSEEWKRRA